MRARCRQRYTMVLCILAGALLVWLDRTHLTRAWPVHVYSAQEPSYPDSREYHDRTFEVTNVVDGDTLDIDAPDGSRSYTRIRLLGIDTPETRTDRGPMFYGPQAAQVARELAGGKRVVTYLDADNNTRDKYGRLLAYVQLPDGRFLNEVLLSDGFAYADLRFRHSYYNRYKQLESTARSQHKGLWVEVSFEQLPDWLKTRKPGLLGGK